MRAFLLVLALARAAAAAPLPDGAFVRADGSRFVVDGKPFLFVGANLAVMQGQRERARYRDTLAAAAADGLTVGRVWALGEGPPDAGAWYRKDHLLRAGPSGFIEDGYVQLDRVLAEARARGIRLVVTLVNNWDDYGGTGEYLRWAGLPTATLADRDRFYSDPRTRAYYREGLEHLLQRTNTITGVKYVDDPTIFAWELMNESMVASAEGASARRQWIGEMASFIRARDAHHMITPGLIGYTTRNERSEWAAVCRLPSVDYCDSHLYPQTSARVTSWAALAALVDDRAQLARFVIGKPLVIGEFGFLTSDAHGRNYRDWRGRARAAWFARFLDRVFSDGAAGAMAWIYQPYLDRRRNFGIYVDNPETADVRAALRARAERLADGKPYAPNPRLGPRVGARMLYDPTVTLHGGRAPHDDWRVRDGGERLLEIDPTAFATARFDEAGRWDRGVLEHVYGDGAGRFEYRFTTPRGTFVQMHIEARVSAEWPGTNGPPDGKSPYEVVLDGKVIAKRIAGRDDGMGEVAGIDVEDAAILSDVMRPGAHTLAFVVPEVPEAHGLCIYGAPTGNGEVPIGELGPIRIRLETAAGRP